MTIRKNVLMSIGSGETKVFPVTPREMMSARSYIYKFTLLTDIRFSTKYDKLKKELSITKLK